MILVDTSVWVDHIRKADAWMLHLLEQGEVLLHPFVAVELALHTVANRLTFLRDLKDLPLALTAGHEEVMALIGGKSLFGKGLGYVDSHLFASALLMTDVRLWTKDKRLRAVAEAYGVAVRTAG